MSEQRGSGQPAGAAALRADSDSIEGARERLHTVRRVLREQFVGRDDAIDTIVYGAVADLPILFIGPPGTAKSKLINSFCELLGLSGHAPDGGKSDIFQYLLSEFTVPEELFGYPDLRRFESEGIYARADQDMVQNATVVFLDEVFNASSALLNSMLSLLNERCYYDRGRRRPARYRIFLGATQEPPQREELAALYDRFTLRVPTQCAEEEDQAALLRLGIAHRLRKVEPISSMSDISALGLEVQARQLALYKQLSDARTTPPGALRFLRLIRHLRSIGVPISDRKIIQLCTACLARAVVEADPDPFSTAGLLILRFALHDPADEAVLSLLDRAILNEGGGGAA